jgi:hypothetical protein
LSLGQSGGKLWEINAHHKLMKLVILSLEWAARRENGGKPPEIPLFDRF